MVWCNCSVCKEASVQQPDVLKPRPADCWKQNWGQRNFFPFFSEVVWAEIRDQQLAALKPNLDAVEDHSPLPLPTQKDVAAEATDFMSKLRVGTEATQSGPPATSVADKGWQFKFDSHITAHRLITSCLSQTFILFGCPHGKKWGGGRIKQNLFWLKTGGKSWKMDACTFLMLKLNTSLLATAQSRDHVVQMRNVSHKGSVSWKCIVHVQRFMAGNLLSFAKALWLSLQAGHFGAYSGRFFSWNALICTCERPTKISCNDIWNLDVWNIFFKRTHDISILECQNKCFQDNLFIRARNLTFYIWKLEFPWYSVCQFTWKEISLNSLGFTAKKTWLGVGWKIVRDGFDLSRGTNLCSL